MTAWSERDISCDCDHNEYCGKCWPLEFREGGKWHSWQMAQILARRALAGAAPKDGQT